MRLRPFEILRAVYADLPLTTSGICAPFCADFPYAAAQAPGLKQMAVRSV
jgi:hypothetical protein